MAKDVAVVLRDGGADYEVLRGTPAHLASLEWARAHSLDPNRIPAGSVVERDAHRFRILYEEILFRDGVPVVDGLDVVVVDRVEQGEAPPMPFPMEVGGW